VLIQTDPHGPQTRKSWNVGPQKARRTLGAGDPKWWRDGPRAARRFPEGWGQGEILVMGDYRATFRGTPGRKMGGITYWGERDAGGPARYCPWGSPYLAVARLMNIANRAPALGQPGAVSFISPSSVSPRHRNEKKFSCHSRSIRGPAAREIKNVPSPTGKPRSARAGLGPAQTARDGNPINPVPVKSGGANAPPQWKIRHSIFRERTLPPSVVQFVRHPQKGIICLRPPYGQSTGQLWKKKISETGLAPVL